MILDCIDIAEWIFVPPESIVKRFGILFVLLVSLGANRLLVLVSVTEPFCCECALPDWWTYLFLLFIIFTNLLRHTYVHEFKQGEVKRRITFIVCLEIVNGLKEYVLLLCEIPILCLSIVDCSLRNDDFIPEFFRVRSGSKDHIEEIK